MQHGLQKKTIESYISGRINNWCFSFNRYDCLKHVVVVVDPENLTDDEKSKITEFQNELRDNVIVTGGAIPSMLLGEEVNDLDIYFKNQDIAKKVATYYLNTAIADGNLKETSAVHNIGVVNNPHGGVDVVIRSQGVTGDAIKTDDYQYFEHKDPNLIDSFFKEFHAKAKARKEEGKRFGVAFITSNAITLNNKIQMILRFCGEPETIHTNFDFIHATNYWTKATGVVYNTEALEATLERRLYYFGSKFPVSTIFRLRKFIERGWRISAGEMMKIAFDVSKLDLSSVQVLRDQTIGMDSAYFQEVIAILEKRDDKTLDRTYLFSIINMIFNSSEQVEVDDNGEIVLPNSVI